MSTRSKLMSLYSMPTLSDRIRRFEVVGLHCMEAAIFQFDFSLLSSLTIAPFCEILLASATWRVKQNSRQTDATSLAGNI
mmetsp:Transcript_9729/g.15552  ORF Transcript_9729/g.15552 Transcript_9729/m.15552 type:complete len:80 (-) Transcript_9729:2-241(-)